MTWHSFKEFFSRTSTRILVVMLIPGLVWGTFVIFRPDKAEAAPATVVILASTGSSNWSVPSDWNSASNTIEVIGGGGGGRTAASTVGGAGGGGGGYAKISNMSLSIGALVPYSIATSGTAGQKGGDTIFGTTTLAGCVTLGVAACVGAQGGQGATGISVTLGGTSTAGVGTTKSDGGRGGTGNANGGYGGGGGTAGPSGVGRDGGNGRTGGGGDDGGGGGGGSNGGSSTAGAIGTGNGGNGGTGTSGGANGGTGGTNAAGANGTQGTGAGGGGGDTGFSGGNGATSSVWTTLGSATSSGPGGGGGGAGSGTGGNGGNGGTYGGGAGGGNTGGTGGSGIIVITYTPLDTTPPSSNPIFSTVPTNTSSSALTMTSVTVTDSDSPPVNYYFTATSSSCTSGHGGTGASDSGWQASATYAPTGLQANKCYGWTVTARDSASPSTNQTATSTASSTYTSAAVPGALSLSSVSSSTMVITNAENGNPASNPTTDFKVYATSSDANWNNRYVDATGNPTASVTWLTDAQIDGLTIKGLSENIQYRFVVVARNADGDLTASSTQSAATTLDLTPPTPNPMTFSGAPNDASDTSVNMTATAATDAASPSAEYYFGYFACAANNGTGGSDSGWQGSNSYTDAGLQPNQCYGYKTQARDQASPKNYTASSSQSEAYTAAAVPSAPTLSGETGNTFVLTNNENGNPAANPVTFFAVEASTSDAAWNGKYVDAGGNPTGGAVWLTDSQLTGLTVLGLSAGTTYQMHIKARNESLEETAYGSYGTIETDEGPVIQPPILRLQGGIRLQGTRLQ